MKGVQVLRDGSLESVSLSLGDAHKVRNFYNNIVAPDSQLGEVTIDTHAVAAAVFKPLSAKGYEVSHAFVLHPLKILRAYQKGLSVLVREAVPSLARGAHTASLLMHIERPLRSLEYCPDSCKASLGKRSGSSSPRHLKTKKV